MVEYIKALWGWPTVALILILCFRREIRQVIAMMSKGLEAKFGSLSVTFPLSVEERQTESGRRAGNVTSPVSIPSGVTELQAKILQEFIRRGNYDTMNVSKNLIGDFRYLKMQGFLAWDRDEEKGDQVSLTNFGVTEEGKKKV